MLLPVATDLSQSADEKSIPTVQRFRALLATAYDEQGSSAIFERLTTVVSFQELIHTSYFDHPGIIEILADHITGRREQIGISSDISGNSCALVGEVPRERPLNLGPAATKKRPWVDIWASRPVHLEFLTALTLFIAPACLLALGAKSAYQATVAPETLEYQVDRIETAFRQPSHIFARAESLWVGDVIVQLAKLGRIEDPIAALASLRNEKARTASVALLARWFGEEGRWADVRRLSLAHLSSTADDDQSLISEAYAIIAAAQAKTTVDPVVLDELIAGLRGLLIDGRSLSNDNAVHGWAQFGESLATLGLSDRAARILDVSGTEAHLETDLRTRLSNLQCELALGIGRSESRPRNLWIDYLKRACLSSNFYDRVAAGLKVIFKFADLQAARDAPQSITYLNEFKSYMDQNRSLFLRTANHISDVNTAAIKTGKDNVSSLTALPTPRPPGDTSPRTGEQQFIGDPQQLIDYLNLAVIEAQIDQSKGWTELLDSTWKAFGDPLYVESQLKQIVMTRLICFRLFNFLQQMRSQMPPPNADRWEAMMKQAETTILCAILSDPMPWFSVTEANTSDGLYFPNSVVTLFLTRGPEADARSFLTRLLERVRTANVPAWDRMNALWRVADTAQRAGFAEVALAAARDVIDAIERERPDIHTGHVDLARNIAESFMEADLRLAGRAAEICEKFEEQSWGTHRASAKISIRRGELSKSMTIANTLVSADEAVQIYGFILHEAVHRRQSIRFPASKGANKAETLPKSH
jgi:hypothetical protein